MQIPKLIKGLKNITVGEIIGLVSSSLFGTISSALLLDALDRVVDDTLLAGVLGMVGTVCYAISIVGSILSSLVMFIGLIRIHKEDYKFKEAIVMIIIPMIGFIIQLFISNSTNLRVIETLLDLWYMVAVTQGLVNVCDNVKERNIANKGITVIKQIICLYTIAIVAHMIQAFFATSRSFALVGFICLIVDEFTEILMNVFYIGYIIKVRKMLVGYETSAISVPA